MANGYIDNLGLQKGDRVAVLSKNSIEFIENYFACARTGLIIQPLNWRLSTPELTRILSDGKPSVFVNSIEFSEVAKELQRELDINHWLKYGDHSDSTYEDLISAALDDEPHLSAQVGDDDPMLILYTGGTTGESKGALHTHKGFYAGMLNQITFSFFYTMLLYGMPIVSTLITHMQPKLRNTRDWLLLDHY
ncbi:AMP-binding protein [Schinkia sp. CFF1]